MRAGPDGAAGLTQRYRIESELPAAAGAGHEQRALIHRHLQRGLAAMHAGDRGGEWLLFRFILTPRGLTYLLPGLPAAIEGEAGGIAQLVLGHAIAAGFTRQGQALRVALINQTVEEPGAEARRIAVGVEVMQPVRPFLLPVAGLEGRDGIGEAAQEQDSQVLGQAVDGRRGAVP